MTISQEDIKRVKEELGDKNADLIASITGMEKYDARRKVGCCPNPSHDDSHPSCSYNPKTKSFHCFSCGYTIDILDAYMQFQGKTFIDACASAFEDAEIPFSTAEKGVLRDNGYRYPKPVHAETKDNVYDYWSKRKISREVIDYLGIQEEAGTGNTLFEYRNLDDTLVMVKVRPSKKIAKGETKCWFLKGSDTKHILYNMNKVNTSQPLVLCCGEGDVAALVQSGIYNAVSISHGEKSYDFINECYEWLDLFETIILVYDHDETGYAFSKEVCRRLGEDRVKTAEWNEIFVCEDGTRIKLKDANEVLFHLGESALREAINNAKAAQIDSIIDIADVQEEDMNDVSGFTSGIKPLDDVLVKFYDGDLTIISGSPSSGKTSFLANLVIANIDQGRGVWMYSGELASGHESQWILTSAAGQRGLEMIDTGGAPHYRIKQGRAKKIKESMRGNLFLYKDDRSHKFADVVASAVSTIKRHGVRVLFFDNMASLDLESGDSKWDNQQQLIQQLVGIAKQYNVCVILVIHPKKTDSNSSRPNLYTISGVTSSINLSHRVISLYRVTKKDREGQMDKKTGRYYVDPINASVVVDILKDRHNSATGASIPVWYDVPSRRFYSTKDELDRPHVWDDDIDFSGDLPFGCEKEEVEYELYGNVG